MARQFPRSRLRKQVVRQFPRSRLRQQVVWQFPCSRLRQQVVRPFPCCRLRQQVVSLTRSRLRQQVVLSHTVHHSSGSSYCTGGVPVVESTRRKRRFFSQGFTAVQVTVKNQSSP